MASWQKLFRKTEMRILTNGTIHTHNPNQPFAEALAVEYGRVLAVGSIHQIAADYGAHAEETDLAHRHVFPGLTDAHIHLEKYALSLTVVDCETATQAECLRRVAQRAQELPAGAWLRGHGWNQNVWPEGFGSVEELDAISSEIPIYLTAKSLHAAWANTTALRLAGIDDNTPDPQDGRIMRTEHGQPSGILLEGAMALVEGVMPAPTLLEITQAIDAAQAQLWRYGLTGLHDYDPATCFSALQVLDQRDALRLRVVKGIPLELLPQAIELGLHTGFGSAFLRIGSVKLFADGALGPHTAAMLQPYEGDPGNTGILFLDSEQVYEHGQMATSAGISMAIHAIGDRANHEVLNAYAQLREFETAHGLPHLRHRIEHVQCLHPQDAERLAQLGVIASVQPIHATSDMDIADRYWGQRAASAYAYRSLLEAGSHLALGSDAPVESPNPWLGIHAAVTRRRTHGAPGTTGWYPMQKLTLDQALQGYTSGPAYASGQEAILGQLKAGQYADLIVLDDDPHTLPSQELWRVQPRATMVGGDWVWQRG
jgi:predicted amidohydrolase YtcJ